MPDPIFRPPPYRVDAMPDLRREELIAERDKLLAAVRAVKARCSCVDWARALDEIEEICTKALEPTDA